MYREVADAAGLDVMNDLAFYAQVWARLTAEEFTPEKLAKRVHFDGGYDIAKLSESDLIALIEGRFEGDWSGPGFSFSELLAYYSVPGAIQAGEQIVGWIFASFVIADAVRADATDWEMEFNNFIDGFLAVRAKLELEESIHVFERVFPGNQRSDTE